ncbi:hypothetical protein BHM03_00019795 [Ensete ventricosum]|nr:hypothetical protein BHM03_00019795 [Ensete ventricosum]
MSSASSHFESRSVEVSAHRSRVLSHPSGDSVSVAVVSSFDVPGDFGTVDALVAMRYFFNVDSTMTNRWLVEVRKNYFIPLEYELHVPLSGECPYDAFPCYFSLSTDALEAGLRFLLHPVIEACLEWWRIFPSQMTPNSWRYLVAFLWECYGSSIVVTRELFMACFRLSQGAGAGLRKRLRKVADEQPVDASGSTARTSIDKGKRIVELEEVPERVYTIRELYEVEDRAGADKYFTSIMTRLRCVDSEDRLQVYECSSKELMNRAGKSVVWQESDKSWSQSLSVKRKSWRTRLRRCELSWRELEQEVRILRSSLDGARNDRARLEGDILSLTEATAVLEAELKAEGMKAVATYKASRGFKSGLEKMGMVSYEFGYRVALERLWEKQPEIMIEQDPFAECPEDANVEMDLDQPFNDGTLSEK